MSPERQALLAENLRKVLAADGPMGLRELFDSVPVCVVYTDAQQVIRVANQRTEDWYKRSRAKIVGRTTRELIGEEWYAIDGPAIRRALSGEVAYICRPRHYPDGVTRHVFGQLTPDVSHTGVVRGYSAVFTVLASSDQPQHTFHHRPQSVAIPFRGPIDHGGRLR